MGHTSPLLAGGLRFVLLSREPLHVGRMICATFTQRDTVIHPVARARTAGLTCTGSGSTGPRTMTLVLSSEICMIVELLARLMI
jgi:hypothetical protein